MSALAIPQLRQDEVARQYREALKDKSYRQWPLGQDAGRYLRAKRKRLTRDSYRDYEACLDKLARFFTDLEVRDFEPPVGVERLEEFLDHQWGHRAPRTYNKNHSILSDFFRFQVLRGALHGNPMLPIEKAKKRDVHREVFREDDRARILADGPDPDHLRRDRIALYLLLKRGIRKGTLQSIQFRHGDKNRRRLTVFSKGEKVRELPIRSPEFWDDWEKLQFELDSHPDHYLMAGRKTVFWKRDPEGKNLFRVFQYPERPMGEHGLHDWWYGCLERAGVVAVGTTSGERMHKARHTAGQVVLDRTGGNIKAVQKMLGHSDPSTTLRTYVDWDIDQLDATLAEIEDD